MSAALRQYRDSRAVHVSTLKRWRAALRSTDGNPSLVVFAHLPAVEVKRANVVQAVAMARAALLALRVAG